MSQATLGSSAYRNSSLFSGYYLDERIADLDAWECDSEAQDAFEELQRLWKLEGELAPGYKEDELLDSWIDEVVEILGFGTQSETTIPGGSGYNDRLLFDSEETRRDAAKRAMDGNPEAMYGMAAAVLEAKQWDADFSKKFDEQRSYRDASHQIKYYLERTPERLQWGVLTDGRKWRLYGTKDYATEVYYEVDLPELLEAGDLEEFKYFYAFFRPDAFRGIGGTTFLDRVWNESETAAQELGEDLQDNVFTALRVLGEGFIHTNDLDIDPDDEEKRAELKEQSLVLLYRLMFVLYAESRGLINPDNPVAQDEYDEHFSLDQIRVDIHDQITSGDSYDDWSGYATQIWGQLEDLFGLVDEGQESLGIPAYNGGLFDEEKHTFLAENEVADRYIAEVIHRLGTTEGDDGNPVIADYADLDTRHLGSIYEGLLEHEFRIASEPYAAVAEDGGQVWKPGTEVSVAEAIETVEQGELYVVNDEGERKATGAYYTPDYVVNYIVEETIGPLLDDIRDDLEAAGLDPSDQAYFGRFYSEVQDLKILDPAMGSAHFLTSATGYLTEQVMEIVREQERQGRDEQEIRRTIAKECIYGVDINGMAVELGKLSMWLETLAADKPLAFLDHHLKTGNSLIGSDIESVLDNSTPDSDTAEGQLTLRESFERTRREALEQVTNQFEDLLAIDNETLSDIKDMEAVYEEVRDDPLYQHLIAMANVHTAGQFGLDIPGDAHERMAQALRDDDWATIDGQDWYRSAQQMAEDQRFFHWELEFPIAFYEQDGERKDDEGFDAVIGNPPWMDFQRIGNDERTYQRQRFDSAIKKYDLYAVFVEQAINLLKSERSYFGYIIQNKFLSSSYGEGLKEFLVDNNGVRSILDFEDADLFAGTTTYPLILLLSGQATQEFEYAHLEDATDEDVEAFLRNPTTNRIDAEKLTPSRPWIFPNKKEADVVDTLRNNNHPTLDDLSEDISTGIKTNLKEAYVFEKSIEEIPVERELLRPVLDGADIRRYSGPRSDKFIIYPYEGSETSGLTPVNLSNYPKAKEHFLKFEEALGERLFYGKTIEQMGKEWFEFPYKSENLLGTKILFPDISTEPRCTFDSIGESLILNTAYGAVLKPEVDETVQYICALFNSSPLRFMFTMLSPKLSGGYYRFQTQYVGQLPIPTILDAGQNSVESELLPEYYESINPVAEFEPNQFVERHERLSNETKHTHNLLTKLAEEMIDLRTQRHALNLALLDYLGIPSDDLPESKAGDTLGDLQMPVAGVADTPLIETTKTYEGLRIEEVSFAEEGGRVVLSVDISYKLGEEDSRETDRHDRLVESEFETYEAMAFVDLAEAQQTLLREFVPVAVEEADGFAGFRQSARKTISPLDRLRALTLPDIDEVEAGLEQYVEVHERADELEAKMEKTDELIDEIVYKLYGLTDEEIEIVEKAVDE